MSNYTNLLEDKAYDIFEEEDYMEELKKMSVNFRTFDKALDTFIVERGYAGDIENVADKIKYITGKLKAAEVPIPANIRKWYLGHKRIKRVTAFPLCFAFGLQVEEVDDFLRRICLERGFDYHLAEEVVYFFAFKNGLSYVQAQDIKSKLQIAKPGKVPKEDIIYTDLIFDEIDNISTEEELINFINNNAEMFEYNSATAYETIRILWNDISGEDGIALREKKQLYRAFDKDVEEENDYENECEDEEAEIATEEKVRKTRKRIDDSIWEIYLQILGLAGSYANAFYSERSIKKILKDNEMLHPLAEDSFPDRNGLNRVLNGEHLSYERVRKLLILLVFYKFWANKAISTNSYEAGYDDDRRCISYINNNLMDAGYPLLYPGNPYDFIIFASVHSDMPLITFREYMRELFFEKIDIDELY